MRYLIIFIALFLNAKVLVVDDDAVCIDTPMYKGCSTCENSMPAPNGFKTIKDAVKKAGNGDVIKICKGTYNESVIFNKWISITFTSASDVNVPDDVKWKGSLYALKFRGKDLTVENISLSGKSAIRVTEAYGDYKFRNLILNASNGNGIYVKKGKSIEISDVNVTSSKTAIYLFKSYGDYTLKNLHINSQGAGIYIYDGRDISFQNIKISSLYNGIDLINTYGNYDFSNIDINSQKKGIYLNKGRDLSFSDVNVTSEGDSIDLMKPYGNYNFSNVDLDSQNNGIFIGDGHNINISNSKIRAEKVDLNVSNCWGDYTLLNSQFRSISSSALYFGDTNHLRIENCCIKIDSTNGYGLNFNGSNSDYWHKIDVSNNCFYGDLEHLARAKNHNTISGNYWNNLNGVYDYNNILDNNPLTSCPNSCWNWQGGEGGYFNSVSAVFYNDAKKDWDNNLSTQIVNKNFNLWILSKDDNNNSASAEIKKVGLYLYANTLCSGDYDKFQSICENNCPNTNVNGEVIIQDVEVSNAYKCAKVYVEGKIIGSLNPDYKEANSSDEFAVRPKEFNVTLPKKVVANRNFEVNLTLLDNEGNLIDYNGSLNIVLDLNASKNGCRSSDRSYVKNLSFNKGKAQLDVIYSNVADLNVKVKEGAPEFAEIDKNDGISNSTRFIDENLTSTKAIPKYFEVNTTLKNFDNGFTYLDKNLNVYGILDINLTARGEGDILLTNYSNSCYGSDINLSFKLDYNQTPTLSRLVTNENNFSIDEINTTLTTFSNGVGNKEIHFNYDKNYSNPIPPFEMNLSKGALIQKESNNSVFNGKGDVTFYYGTLYLDDVVTTSNEANNSAKLIAYKTNNGRELFFNWYLNGNDTTTTISNVKVMSGYQNSSGDEISGINVSVTKNGSAFKFDISNIGDNKFFVVHILDNSLSSLWYSKFENDYNVSSGSSCLNHFCFSVSVEVNQTQGAAGSGNFRGTETNVSNRIKIIAPKIYR